MCEHGVEMCSMHGGNNTIALYSAQSSSTDFLSIRNGGKKLLGVCIADAVTASLFTLAKRNDSTYHSLTKAGRMQRGRFFLSI